MSVEIAKKDYTISVMTAQKHKTEQEMKRKVHVCVWCSTLHDHMCTCNIGRLSGQPPN